jgi:hypothetical protein
LLVNAPVKIVGSFLVVLAIGVAICCATGLVSFTSVSTVANEPLRHPGRVMEVDGTNLVLESGQIIALRTFSRYSISNQLIRSDFQIDIEQGDTNGPGAFDIEQGDTNWLDIYARRPGKSDFMRPLVFTIPLIRRTRGATDRVWIASGRYVSTNSQSGRRED